MKGKFLKDLVKASGKTATEVAESLGIKRQHLYNLYAKEDIGGEYATKVEQMGLLKFDKSTVNDNTVPFTAQQLYTMWEEAEVERRRLSDALINLVNTHNQVLAKKFNIAS